MGEPESEQTTLKFWEILAKILRLDTPNPAETWRKLSDKLIGRYTTSIKKNILNCNSRLRVQRSKWNCSRIVLARWIARKQDK